MLNDDNGFFERLWEILGQETQTWWAEKISVSQGTISNCYKKKYMTVDKIIKILSVKQISPTWLMFGIGPKDLKFFDIRKIDEIQDAYRNAQLKLAEVEYENVKLRKEKKALQNTIDQNELLFKSFGKEFNFIGAIAFLRMAIDIVFKMAEAFAKDNVDVNSCGAILGWMKSNLEVQKHSTLATMEQLNAIIRKK